MKKITKILRWGIVVVTLILIIACISIFFKKAQEEHLTDVGLPIDTAVVIHASTFTSSGEVSASPRSEIFFYNQEGKIISHSYEAEEVCGDFMVETADGICYFFKNHSILTSQSHITAKDNESGTEVKSIKFGPSRVGYIEDIDMAYALLNVGKASRDAPYINILRFMSAKETYDIEIPFYLSGVYYDSGKHEFICVIDPLNQIDECSFIDYVVVSFDATSQKFAYQDSINHLYNWAYSENEILNSGCMVQDGTMYQAFIVPENTEDLHGPGSLILSAYDLESHKHLTNTVLLKDYSLGTYGGALIGSNDLPAIDKNGKLYVFSSTKQVFIVSSEKDIQILDMPYLLTDTLPLSSPNYYDYADAKDFTGSQVHVEDDGQIYILSLFRDKHLRIHRLLRNATYELVWDGVLPENLAEDMVINDFEIITPSQ